MSFADAITPTDTERAEMWPEHIVQKLDWALREIGELEVVNNDLTTREGVVNHRADDLVNHIIETRTELTNMGVSLTNVDGYLDRLSNLVSKFKSRIGVASNSEEDDSGSTDGGDVSLSEDIQNTGEGAGAGEAEESPSNTSEQS